jgi:hypothetical protein
MSLTINAKTFASDTAISRDQFQYFGPVKTTTVKDDLILGRTDPKPTPVFSGVAKCNVRYAKTLTLTGALTPSWDIIHNGSTSVPLGASDADIDTFATDLAAYYASADFKNQLKKRKIVF